MDSKSQKSSILGFIGRRRRSASIQVGGGTATIVSPSSDSNPLPSPSQPDGVESPGGLASRMLKRRSAGPALATNFVLPSETPPRTSISTPLMPIQPSKSSKSHKIRFVPHLGQSRSLHFDPVLRSCKVGGTLLKIGRFLDLDLPNEVSKPSLLGGVGATKDDKRADKVAFRSKVVSRTHAVVWVDADGQFWIKDTRSSSGTFINNIRLSPSGQESGPHQIHDGEIIQLGVDYKGGREEMYRAVRIKIELGQKVGSKGGEALVNNSAAQFLKNVQSVPPAQQTEYPDKENVALNSDAPRPSMSNPGTKAKAIVKGKTKTVPGAGDCCICLLQVNVCKAVFISPCSHAFHYRCIRPLLELHHPGFSCPLCRTFANLDSEVETAEQPEVEDSADFSSGPEDFSPAAIVAAATADRKIAKEDHRTTKLERRITRLVGEGPSPKSRPTSSSSRKSGHGGFNPLSLANAIATHAPRGHESKAERQDRLDRKATLEQLDLKEMEHVLKLSKQEYETQYGAGSERATTPGDEALPDHGPLIDFRASTETARGDTQDLFHRGHLPPPIDTGRTPTHEGAAGSPPHLTAPDAASTWLDAFTPVNNQSQLQMMSARNGSPTGLGSPSGQTPGGSRRVSPLASPVVIAGGSPNRTLHHTPSDEPLKETDELSDRTEGEEEEHDLVRSKSDASLNQWAGTMAADPRHNAHPSAI